MSYNFDDEYLIDYLNQRNIDTNKNLQYQLNEFKINPEDIYLNENGIPTDMFLEKLKQDVKNDRYNNTSHSYSDK